MADSLIFCNRGLVLLVLLAVVVTHFADAQSQILVEGPDDKHVILGGTTELKCTLQKSLILFFIPVDLQTQWKRRASGMVYNDRSACSNTNFRVCVENRDAGDNKLTTRLEIRNINLEDAGTYSCEYSTNGLDFTFLAEGIIVVSSPVIGSSMDPSSADHTTSKTFTPSVTTRERLILATPSGTTSPAVNIVIISASSCFVVGLVIGVLVLLLRRFRGTSSQQRGQALSRQRTPTQDQASVVFSKGRAGPTYENEGPAMEAAGFASKTVYENAHCLTDNIYDDTVAQRAIPSSMKDCEDQQVYMNHQVQKGKPHRGPRK